MTGDLDREGQKMTKALDREGAQMAKDTKHEERKDGAPRRESSRFVVFVSLRDFVIQTPP